MKILLITIAVVFGAVRLWVGSTPVDPKLANLFKDTAHLYVGGLFGAYALALGIRSWMIREYGIFLQDASQITRRYRWILWTALGLTLAEIIAALPKILALFD